MSLQQIDNDLGWLYLDISAELGEIECSQGYHNCIWEYQRTG